MAESLAGVSGQEAATWSRCSTPTACIDMSEPVQARCNRKNELKRWLFANRQLHQGLQGGLAGRSRFSWPRLSILVLLIGPGPAWLAAKLDPVRLADRRMDTGACRRNWSTRPLEASIDRHRPEMHKLSGKGQGCRFTALVLTLMTLAGLVCGAVLLDRFQ